MSTSNINLYRFNKRLQSFNKDLAAATVRIEDIGRQAEENVKNQKILNKHLAERNAAYRKLNETPQEKVKLCLVK